MLFGTWSQAHAYDPYDLYGDQALHFDLHASDAPAWWSGYCYFNKGECDLNQSKDDSFDKRVAKNNNWNNGDRHKIHEIFLINCFVFVIILVWQTVHSSAMTQITANVMEKTLQLTVSMVTVLALDGLTKKHFGHYALLKISSLRSPNGD